jgi:hypothetical protein
MASDLIQETKQFNISTRSSACKILNTNTDYKSNCEFNIPNMIERDDLIEYIQFSVPMAVVPVSFYTINENNCVLDVSVNNVTTKYTFPYGNYTANYFITQFVSSLGSNWGISLSSYNSVFTITNSSAAFTLLSSSTITSVMGFSSNVNSSLSATYSATLPRCCNFLPLPRINLRCAELANTTTVGATTTSDIVLSIPNNAKPNGQIYYLNQSNSKLLFRHHELNRFVISLTDDDGNFINFNGVSSFFTLQFDIFRKFVPKPPRFSDIVGFVNNSFYDGGEQLELENI